MYSFIIDVLYLLCIFLPNKANKVSGTAPLTTIDLRPSPGNVLREEAATPSPGKHEPKDVNKLRELQSTETTNISESFISWLILFHLLLCHSYKIRKSLCFHRSKSIVTKLGIMIKYNWSKTKIQMSRQVVQDCGSPLSKIHGLIQLWIPNTKYFLYQDVGI